MENIEKNKTNILLFSKVISKRKDKLAPNTSKKNSDFLPNMSDIIAIIKFETVQEKKFMLFRKFF